MSDCLQPQGLQHARLPCPPLSPGVCSNSCPLCQGCHPTILSSVATFSFCLQALPASGSFPMSWLFSSGGQSIGASTSASALPKNIQGWFPSGLTGLISLLSKGFSRVFSSTKIWKHQFFSPQLFMVQLSHNPKSTSLCLPLRRTQETGTVEEQKPWFPGGSCSRYPLEDEICKSSYKFLRTTCFCASHQRHQQWLLVTDSGGCSVLHFPALPVVVKPPNSNTWNP